jgi:hypothetical protein
VLPRTAVSGRGFFYWAGIRAYPDQRSYVDAMLALTQEEVTLERLNNCHDLAEICHRKYRVLRLAIWTWVVGVLATVVFIIGFASDAPERDGVAAPLQPPAVAARPAVR